jgi:pyridoxamine 5'-phosphate oxidase
MADESQRSTASAAHLAPHLAPHDEPFTRFTALFEEAKRIPRDVLPEPTAFSLGTVDERGHPSVRIVLLKTVDARGFVFYTNYESRKGRELLATKRAALCFHWQLLETQVRVEGDVVTVSDAEADAYFTSRARGSQIGAWASIQSRVMDRPEDLEARVTEVERRFAGAAVTRPPHWSGFRVVPARIEFWKNMPSRLHVRHVYVKNGAGWKVEQLYP